MADGKVCPVETVQQILSGKWKVMILYLLSEKPKRFGELQRELHIISQSTLTAQLRELEHAGMINRKVFAEIPPHVEYSLTSIGMDFKPILDSIGAWGRKYLEEMDNRQAVLR